MGHPKGVSGNPGGRPKGTPNKVTTTMREWVAGLLDNNRSRLEEDFKRLSPKDRLLIAERLLHYVLPKQQAISGSIETKQLPKEPELDLSQVSDEDLATMIDIIGKYSDKQEPNC